MLSLTITEPLLLHCFTPRDFSHWVRSTINKWLIYLHPLLLMCPTCWPLIQAGLMSILSNKSYTQQFWRSGWRFRFFRSVKKMYPHFLSKTSVGSDRINFSLLPSNVLCESNKCIFYKNGMLPNRHCNVSRFSQGQLAICEYVKYFSWWANFTD